MVSRSVRCRGSAERMLASRTVVGPSRRPRMVSGDSERNRAATSSRASGSPSRRRQISTMTGRLVGVRAKSGTAAPTRATRRATAGTSADGLRSRPLLWCGRERGDGEDHLARQAQGLAGRGQHVDARALQPDAVDQGHQVVQHVLAAVEDHQLVPPGEGCHQRVVHRELRVGLDVQRGRHRVEQGGRVGDRGQLHDRDPIAEPRRPRSHPPRQACLAHPARADQRHQGVVGHGPADAGQLLVSAHQRGRVVDDRCRPGRHGRPLVRGVGASGRPPGPGPPGPPRRATGRGPCRRAAARGSRWRPAGHRPDVRRGGGRAPAGARTARGTGWPSSGPRGRRSGRGRVRRPAGTRSSPRWWRCAARRGGRPRPAATRRPARRRPGPARGRGPRPWRAAARTGSGSSRALRVRRAKRSASSAPSGRSSR